MLHLQTPKLDCSRPEPAMIRDGLLPSLRLTEMSPGALSGYPKISKLHKQVGSELRSAGRSLLVNFDRVLQFYLTTVVTVVTRKNWIVYQLKWGTVWAATGLPRIGRGKESGIDRGMIRHKFFDQIPKCWHHPQGMRGWRVLLNYVELLLQLQIIDFGSENRSQNMEDSQLFLSSRALTCPCPNLAVLAFLPYMTLIMYDHVVNPMINL